MDTEEMYRRGVADAEQGEPHPFYYQHYYQYRRGYDRARRSRGLPGGIYDVRRRRRTRLIAIALLLIAGVVVVLVWRGRIWPTAARRPTAQPAAIVAPAIPTRTPIVATPTPSPAPPPAVLHAGGVATVANTQGAPLRGRKQPSAKAPVAVSFKEGEQVRILEGPVDADGFTWWRVKGPGGTGWSAQQSKEGAIWLVPASDQ
ncbi:MAG TPA: hypothetical protein VF897_24880 [Roseiflexaceae bacterium]